MIIIAAIIIAGFIGVITAIIISGHKLMMHIKSEYVGMYKDQFEQHGLIVDTFSPNLFLLSAEAKSIAEKDELFKKLRRNYGLAWFSLPLWLISIGFITFFIGRFIT